MSEGSITVTIPFERIELATEIDRGVNGVKNGVNGVKDDIDDAGQLDNAFDEIYPMHGSFPVKNDLIGKLIEGANLIKGGKVEGRRVDMFGTSAMFYKFPYAGFLCDSQ